MKKKIIITLTTILVVVSIGLVVADPLYDFNLERNPLWSAVFNAQDRISTLENNSRILETICYNTTNFDIHSIVEVDATYSNVTYQNFNCIDGIVINTAQDYITVNQTENSYTILQSGYYDIEFNTYVLYDGDKVYTIHFELSNGTLLEIYIGGGIYHLESGWKWRFATDNLSALITTTLISDPEFLSYLPTYTWFGQISIEHIG